MRTFFVLTSLLFLVSCTRTPDLTRDEVYDIMNQIITDDSLQFSHRLLSKFDRPAFGDDLQKFFTADDIKFINRQIEKLSDMKIEANKIKRAGWRVFEKRHYSPFVEIISPTADSLSHTYFAFPLISSDRKKVILKLVHRCGFLCGGHEVFLFEKKSSKWVVTDTLELTIS